LGEERQGDRRIGRLHLWIMTKPVQELRDLGKAVGLQLEQHWRGQHLH
jgi:hypothetical protein